MNHNLPRRQFLRHVVVSSTGFTLLKSASSAWTAQANEKLNLALIGVGGRGEWFTSAIPRRQNLVALCDVDENKNPDAYERNPRAKRFKDFRKMLDQMGKSIDGVVVATPDHTHAVASAAAIRAGKPVFCEKPLTRTVHESRALRELARQQKVATSMGNQGTAAGPFRRALELIRGGTLGTIQEVHVWNDSGGANRKQPPQGRGPAPETLEWDLWLGPAAYRPYNKEWMSRHLWREFGTSQLGNWASHTANLAFMALKVQELWLRPQDKAPLIGIKAQHSGVNPLSFPQWELIEWSLPARMEFPPVTFRWHNGHNTGTRSMLEEKLGEGLDWGDKKNKKWDDFAGALIIGSEGYIHTTGHNATFRLLPEDKFRDLQRDRPERVEASRGHEEDWFTACGGGSPAWSNFDYADALNEFLMLGNVSTQFEEKLEFDPVGMKIVNSPAADALLRSEYRKGWTL